MAIIKLSKSGRQIQFVDDFGNVYGTSGVAVHNLLDGKVKQGYTMLMRLPFKVSTSRFGVSPLWNPDGNTSLDTPGVLLPDSSVNTSNDAFSQSSLKKEEVKNNVEDKVVW